MRAGRSDSISYDFPGKSLRTFYVWYGEDLILRKDLSLLSERLSTFKKTKSTLHFNKHQYKQKYTNLQK